MMTTCGSSHDDLWAGLRSLESWLVGLACQDDHSWAELSPDCHLWAGLLGWLVKTTTHGPN
jgi:hypothetical protein